MDRFLWEQANLIVRRAIACVQPDEAVTRALKGASFSGRVVLVAAGKAAWQMAAAASACLGSRIDAGIVITKYAHSKGKIADFTICEAGHPVPDENSFAATRKAVELVQGLRADDTVLFLLSGGGSALFELPLIDGAQLQALTGELLACGADITEINILRKRLSAVKGGKFAKLCAPAKVFSIVLSDILGDPLDMIASGPACPDSSTAEQAMAIVRKYGLSVSGEVEALLQKETVQTLSNVETHITGSVRQLCAAAERTCRELGYETVFLTDRLCCEAREAGSFLASILRSHEKTDRPLAFLAGGETVVHLTGSGKGGRNQELALAASAQLAGMDGAAVFSIGSDGTDGPTDAAGGYADGQTMDALRDAGLDLYDVLKRNDAYHALQKTGGLLITGPTGTNVNDVAVALLYPAALRVM